MLKFNEWMKLSEDEQLDEVIKGAEHYAWHQYHGDHTVIHSTGSTRKFEMRTGDHYGVRGSHDGSKVRMVHAAHGVNKVLTLHPADHHRLVSASKVVGRPGRVVNNQ